MLQNYYPEEYDKIAQKYFDFYFAKQNFESENQVRYLYNFAIIAFENNDKVFIDRILAKLRTTTGWKIWSGTFEEQIFKKYHVKL